MLRPNKKSKADDFLDRLICAYGQLTQCVEWAIDNENPHFAANLCPVALTFSAILTQMLDRHNETLSRRRKMQLVKKESPRVALTTPSIIKLVVDNAVQNK